ncbi:MAG: N,N-dimethylformamidase beta subunit family domain-containing protein, partial [Acidimicrobiales bacterium]
AYTVHRPDHWAFAGTGLRWGDQLGTGSFVVGYEVDGCAFTTVNGLPEPTGEDSAPAGLQMLATSPARLLSIDDDRCEAPEALWASIEPPGDLEGVSMVLFGDASEENLARLAHGHAVMASFERGAGTVFNAGSADWAYGLDGDRTVQQVTGNVLRRLGGAR